MNSAVQANRRSATGIVVTVVAAALVVLGLCGALYFREARAIDQLQRDREAARVRIFYHFVRSELRPVTQDLRTLAAGDGLQAYLVSGAEADRERAINRAAFYSRLHPTYDKVRYLDQSGREDIRVNHGGQVVPRAELQDMSQLPFFRDTWSLPRDSVYESAFDLNVEKGAIESPIKPTLRLAMPVFDAAGRKRGVYVINYLGTDLFRRLQELVPGYSNRLRLLNADGYWLKGTQPEDEWGFVLPGRADRNLARSAPALWRRIEQEPEGQEYFEGGLFTWKRVPTILQQEDAGGPMVAASSYFVIASAVGAPEWNQFFAGIRTIFLIVTPVLCGLAGVGAWLLQSRRRALAALRRSEESLAVTLHSIGDAVLATDIAGRVTLLNPVAEQMTGWKLAEAAGRPVGEVFHIVHEETRQPAPIPVEKVLATGARQELANHTTLIARDGTERAIADSAAPIRNREGRTLGVVMVFRDVTETSKAEAELKRFFSVSLDLMCIASMDGYFKRVSPAVAEMLGWTPEEFTSRPFMDMIHPDDHPATLRELERQAAGHKVMHFECRFQHKDGSWRTLSWRSIPQPGGLIYATARDVTEYKRLEQQREEANAELQRNRAELRSLFESLPGLFLVLTPELRIVTASDAYLSATMTQREAIAGRGLFEVFPDNPGDPAADGVRNLHASLQRVMTRKTPDTMAIQKYDIRRADGTFEERYWSPINSPLLDGNGELRYLIHRVEDVTDFVRRQSTNGREKSEAELRHRLGQMEAEIFQSSQRVQAANLQLEAANRELEAFSYSVSHDLRAPLRHIQGYVEMLNREAKDGLSEKAQRYLRTIADAGKEMGTLIDDLLAFSRMGRSEMVEQEVDLGALVTEVRRSLEPGAAGRDIRWTVGALPRVRGDAAMLRQVLVNLLGNAVKYTRGRAPAEIAVEAAGSEEGRLVFRVRDNGAGFDMKYADKLFGVFQRLHRADEFEGTGIGLASVRRIVARHGGRTWAESRPNAGAMFYFSLPGALPPNGKPFAHHETQTHPAR